MYTDLLLLPENEGLVTDFLVVDHDFRYAALFHKNIEYKKVALLK